MARGIVQTKLQDQEKLHVRGYLTVYIEEEAGLAGDSTSGVKTNSSLSDGVHQDMSMTEEERDALKKKGHECPVPKPRGWIGQMLGFTEEAPKKESRNLRVEVEPRNSRN